MKRRNLIYFLNLAGIIFFIIPSIIVTISKLIDNHKIENIKHDAIWLSRYKSHYDNGLEKIIKSIDSNNNHKIDINNWQIVKQDTGYLFMSKVINKTIIKVKIDGSISEEKIIP